MATSIIIPTGGAMYLPRLRTCLRSVWAQRTKPREVIVTYVHPRGAAVPNLQEFRRAGCRVVVHAHDEPDFPPSLARNVGLRVAKAKLVMTVDADAVLDVRTVGTCEKLLSHGDSFVRIRTRMSGCGPEAVAFKQLEPPRHFVREARRWRWAPGPGCIVAAPRKTVFQLGGWDERFVGYGPAVLDWVARLKQAGLQEIVLPDDYEPRHICSMHQNHPRVRDQEMNELRKANIRRYNVTLKGGDPVRNKGGWGR